MQVVVDSTFENEYCMSVSEHGQEEQGIRVPSKRVSRYQLSSDGGSGIGGSDPIESRADGYDANDDESGSVIAPSAAPLPPPSSTTGGRPSSSLS